MQSDNIPRILFMIWIGDNVPEYAAFSLDAYKTANPDFEVKLVHYTLSQLEEVYKQKGQRSQLDSILYESIVDILNHSQKYETILDKTYMYMLEHQETFYGKDIRFIQLLSDIYRMKILDYFGGIYVDCDTFPMKSFDDELLRLRRFKVQHHYNNNAECNLGDDNYFIGSVQADSTQSIPTKKIVQTYDKWWSDINFLMRKRRFFNRSLELRLDSTQPFYIEHYCDGNWQNKKGVIRTPRCFLDDLYRR